MIAELVVSYMLQSSQPVYTNTAYAPFTRYTVQLNVRQDFGKYAYVDVNPYMWGAHNPSRAGVQLDAGVNIGSHAALEVFHESYHDLDTSGTANQLNGIRLRWRFW